SREYRGTRPGDIGLVLTCHHITGTEVGKTAGELFLRRSCEFVKIAGRRILIGDLVVGLGRLELPTSPLSGARSSHLSYRPSGIAEAEFPNSSSYMGRTAFSIEYN